MAPGKGWLDWLLSEERRRARRRKLIPLVAYYWDGAQPVAHQVVDASPSGLYLLTDHRWYPGTILAMTLQRTGVEADEPERAIAVNVKVVRSGEDGVGFEFVLPDKDSKRAPVPLPAEAVDRKQLQSFLSHVLDNKGQALVEYILILPVLFLLIINVVNFGGFFYAWITVADAARSGANYAALGPSAAGAPSTPSLSQVTAVITAEVASLPNATGTNPVVTACSNSTTTDGGKVYGSATNCGFTLKADPESGYTAIGVQVVYTYKPYFPLYSIGNVHLTLPPTTITQTAYMRALL